MTKKSFSAQIADFNAALKAEILRIVQDAATYMYDDMQTPLGLGGWTPVDTDTLRQSLQSSVNGVVLETGAFSYRGTLRRMKLGDRHSTGRARIKKPDGQPMDYGEKQEYGFMLNNGIFFPGRRFTRGPTGMWEKYVAMAAGSGVS